MTLLGAGFTPTRYLPQLLHAGDLHPHRDQCPRWPWDTPIETAHPRHLVLSLAMEQATTGRVGRSSAVPASSRVPRRTRSRRQAA